MRCLRNETGERRLMCNLSFALGDDRNEEVSHVKALLAPALDRHARQQWRDPYDADRGSAVDPSRMPEKEKGATSRPRIRPKDSGRSPRSPARQYSAIARPGPPWQPRIF